MTHKQDKKHKQDNMKDKLIKGLGVSLAKTPSMVLLKQNGCTSKAGTPWQFFFMRVVLFGCVAVCYSGEHS